MCDLGWVWWAVMTEEEKKRWDRRRKDERWWGRTSEHEQTWYEGSCETTDFDRDDKRRGRTRVREDDRRWAGLREDERWWAEVSWERRGYVAICWNCVRFVFVTGVITGPFFLFCVTYGGGVKCLHIERRITGAFHPHPPSHVVRKHAPGWLLVMFSTFASMPPHCTVHMLDNFIACHCTLRFFGRQKMLACMHRAATAERSHIYFDFKEFCVSDEWWWRI